MTKRPTIRVFSTSALSAAMGLVLGGISASASAEDPKLSPEQFEAGKTIYFQHCAGCHGTLRKGATGKSLLPADTKKLGQERLEKILTFGTEGGMNNFNEILTPEEIKLMATYIQMDAPIPPEMSLAQMKEKTKVYVDPKDYPTKPLHGRNQAPPRPQLEEFLRRHRA